MKRSFPFSLTLFALVFLGVFLGCSKKQANSPGGGGAPPERVVQVVTETVGLEPVRETLPQIGTLAANELVEIRAEAAGIVETISFMEGDRVTKDQLLIQIESSKLQAALEESKANLKLSQINYRRNQELFQSQLISRQEYDQANSIYERDQAQVELREEQLKDNSIYAPFDGVVSVRLVSPGQVVNIGQTLSYVMDLDPIKAEFNIQERFLGQVRNGQEVDVKVAAYPDQHFRGEVFFISPFVDPQTRTALVKALVSNPDHHLKPGMFASLDLTLEVRESALVISELAIHQVLPDNYASIYVVNSESRAERRKVLTGMRMRGKIEILEGLKAGEVVIVQGLQKIGPGVKVAPANS